MEGSPERRDPRLAVLAAVAFLAATDVGVFIATEPAVALKTTGRASGSLAGLATWLVLCALAAISWKRPGGPALRRGTTAAAVLAAAYGIGLAAIHVLAHVGGMRSLLGGLAGATVLVLALWTRTLD